MIGICDPLSGSHAGERIDTGRKPKTFGQMPGYDLPDGEEI